MTFKKQGKAPVRENVSLESSRARPTSVVINVIISALLEKSVEGPDSSDGDAFVLEGTSFLTSVFVYKSVFSWRLRFVFKLLVDNDQS